VQPAAPPDGQRPNGQPAGAHPHLQTPAGVAPGHRRDRLWEPRLKGDVGQHVDRDGEDRPATLRHDAVRAADLDASGRFGHAGHRRAQADCHPAAMASAKRVQPSRGVTRSAVSSALGSPP